MAGQLKRWLCLGALATTTLATTSGCQTSRTDKLPNTDMPNSQGRQSMMSQVFGSAKKFPEAPRQSEPLVVKTPRKAGQDWKPDAEVEFANAEFDAASMKQNAVERDQFLDSARQRYLRALKQDPKNKEALNNLSALYYTMGDKANTVATLRTAIQHYPNDHDLHHRLAAVNYKFGDSAAGIEACQAALRLDPQNRVYVKTLAFCQAQQNQWDTAFQTLVQSNVMTQAEARYNLGRLLVDTNRVPEGRQQIQMAMQLDPNYQVAQQFLTSLDTGVPTPPDPAIVNVQYQEPAPR